ncbi:hypothetical protein B9G55_23900 [Saccharibacillus sp. O16]|nr:hypothetical protein B9G55_23900 [Saccharibacillus sp. O16]
MARQSDENIVRVDVTLHKEKYSDVIQAMEEFGSQAGFLKFAARQYIKAQQAKAITPTSAAESPTEEPMLQKKEQTAPIAEVTPVQKEESQKKRRLPPGFGQAQTRHLEE